MAGEQNSQGKKEQFERFWDRNYFFSHLMEHSSLDAIKGMGAHINKLEQIEAMISRVKNLHLYLYLYLDLYLHLIFTKNILQWPKARVIIFKDKTVDILGFVDLRQRCEKCFINRIYQVPVLWNRVTSPFVPRKWVLGEYRTLRRICTGTPEITQPTEKCSQRG